LYRSGARRVLRHTPVAVAKSAVIPIDYARKHTYGVDSFVGREFSVFNGLDG